MTNLTQLKKITTEENARLILDMIEGRKDPCEVSESCSKWVRSCYHEPSRKEQVMHAADEILGTCGVEGWADENGRDGVSYCNTGDPYDKTLVLDHGRFKVTGWGSCVPWGH